MSTGSRSASRDRSMVIVGGGLAGGNAAVALREQGFKGRVVLAGREPGVPFGRPPLSKTYLRSEEELDGWYVKPAAWYADHDIEQAHAEITGVDARTHTVTLDGGRELRYDRLLIATGGHNRRANIPGAELPGIHQLRTLQDCDALKREATAGGRAVIVGMGFIGCEVAASLVQLGVRVTAILPQDAPLQRVLGAEVGGAFAQIHRAAGVDLRAGDQVTGFEGAERVNAAVTTGGARVECDFAVIGIGIEPDVPPFTGARLAVSNGVLVDERCRTAIPDVYAAGDVANHLHPLFGRIRVEHFNNAEKQGRAAARSMLGDNAPYDYVHSFWSDQYEHKLEYVGHVTEWDAFVVRGSLQEHKLLGFYLAGGKVRAAVGLDRGGDPELDKDGEMAACAALVAARADPTPEQLQDERVELWSLVR